MKYRDYKGTLLVVVNDHCITSELHLDLRKDCVDAAYTSLVRVALMPLLTGATLVQNSTCPQPRLDALPTSWMRKLKRQSAKI